MRNVVFCFKWKYPQKTKKKQVGKNTINCRNLFAFDWDSVQMINSAERVLKSFSTFSKYWSWAKTSKERKRKRIEGFGKISSNYREEILLKKWRSRRKPPQKQQFLVDRWSFNRILFRLFYWAKDWENAFKLSRNFPTVFWHSAHWQQLFSRAEREHLDRNANARIRLKPHWQLIIIIYEVGLQVSLYLIK